MQGSMISGGGASYRLVETSPDGSTLTVFERDEPERRIPTEQRQDSVDELRARVDSIRVPRSQVEGVPDEVWSLDVPEIFPAYQAVYADEEDAIWVRRWPPAGSERTIFDVFERSGEFKHAVVLDVDILIEPTPLLSASGVIGVAKHPLTDESMIFRFETVGDDLTTIR